MGTCWELTARTRGGHGGDTWDYLGRGCNKDELGTWWRPVKDGLGMCWGHTGDMAEMSWGLNEDMMGTFWGPP